MGSLLPQHRPRLLAHIGQEVVVVTLSLYLALSLALGTSLSDQIWWQGGHATPPQQAAHTSLTQQGHVQHHAPAEHATTAPAPTVALAALVTRVEAATAGGQAWSVDSGQIGLVGWLLLPALMPLAWRRRAEDIRPLTPTPPPPAHPPR